MRSPDDAKGEPSWHGPCSPAVVGVADGDTLVWQVMRSDPPTVGPEQSLARAAEIMAAAGTRELPVVDGGLLVGILTRSDMEPFRGHYEWTAVRAVMTTELLALDPSTPIRAAAGSLLERGFNSVPVTSGGVLLGMVARSDLLRVLAHGS
jgi:CBS domain-containing protein